MISLLLINYRSSALAADAVRSARAASSQPLQVVIVDNSCDASEAAALESIADELVVSESNCGYAGGINLGRRACRGERIVISNPDVVFGDRSIDLLAAALDDASAAGPALFWDAAHQWFLPPGDVHSLGEKADEVMATRSAAWRASWDARRIRRRLAFWSLKTTTSVNTLSGAVMAIRAADLDALGGFDERFRLYFEETDFLRRLTSLRRRIVYVPAARCRHIFNQSASQDARNAASLFAESEMRYLEKWLGPFAARFLKRAERPLSAAGTAIDLVGPLPLEHSDVVVEASPLASFATAAGTFPAGLSLTVPREIERSLGGAPLYLRLVDRRSARVLSTHVLRSPQPRGGDLANDPG